MRIGFLALAQAHQHLHWIPAALELARRPGVRVHVLCPSRAGIRFIRRYDPERRLRILWIPVSFADGLFADGLFDLSLVGGRKDRRRLIAAGLGSEANVVVAGYAKFELVRPPERIFAGDRPIALYNPHARPELSSWPTMGEAMVRQMEQLADWNFIVAPHVRMEGAPDVHSSAANVRIDPGSIRSIDMTYTQAAAVYIGDASSQVYEFLRTPRPCIFVNAHGIDWRGREEFAHFALGQVIDGPEQLGPALARAHALQPRYEPLQIAAMSDSIEDAAEPASSRQADAILALARELGIYIDRPE